MLKKQVDPESWLQEHGDYLFRYALSRLHHEEIAADMVQETLLAAWRGHARFKGDSTLRTWLVGIMKHKIIDHIRKEIRNRKINHELENDPTSSSFAENGAWQHAPSAWVDNPESRCDDLQFRLVLQQCLEHLPKKQRQVFEMRELAGDDTSTICKACDITSTHLHVLMHRARLALQICLQKHWFGGSNSS
ncbi:MAG: sigma-70 family RNA polymerase sigma factor [Mariprofundaceae bacterium]|nr:sigma-70 family RNA polymerase sigma factor [Mariprofundaceae bacterium]